MSRRPEGGALPPEHRCTLDQWISQELPKHYRSEVLFLRSSGLLEILPKTREMGILGIDGKEYALPTPEGMAQAMREHKEQYEMKLNQGFSELQLTPFGSPLAKLEDRLRKTLLQHFREKKLLGTDYAKDGAAQPINLDLDTDNPLYVWEKLERADETGTLIYYPTQFTKDNHGGKTKQQVLDSTTVFKGWNALLIEDTPVIPRQGNGRTVGNRRQIEAGLSSNDYLKKLLTDPSYAHESGTTPEDEITRFLKQLATKNQVLHDYQNNVDSINLLTGAWVPASGFVPCGCWSRDGRRAGLSGGGPGVAGGRCGSSSAVRIGV